MTTRHTISHADELYRGNAFLGGYSPDGRRGTLMTHLYVREYGVVTAADPDGIVTSYVATGSYSNMVSNTASVCKGALVSGPLGSPIVLDVPRNITLTVCVAETTIPLYVYGKDEYGDDLVETILASGAGVTSGKKAFKQVTKMTTTKAFSTTVSIGTGKRLGLPFYLSNIGKFMGLTVDGLSTGGYTLVAGHATTAVPSSSQNDADVRGTISPTTSPNASLRFSAMMVVDSTTRNKAFGQAQATLVT
jgi:hypothetical protein